MVQEVGALERAQELPPGKIAGLPSRVGWDGAFEDGIKSRVWIEASGLPSLSPGSARSLLRILLKAGQGEHQGDPESPEAWAISS